MDAWDAYLAKNKKIVKFVPASGAASRMFKNLYEFLSADYNEPQNAFEKKFFDDIRKFAFYDALNRACIENEAKDIPALIALGQYKAVVSNLLESKGTTDSFRKVCCFFILIRRQPVRRWKNIWPKVRCMRRTMPAK